MEFILAGVPTVLALIWLALREIAPKTPTKADDRVVQMVEDAFRKINERDGGNA